LHRENAGLLCHFAGLLSHKVSLLCILAGLVAETGKSALRLRRPAKKQNKPALWQSRLGV
jgi:hypothetical protein